MIVRRATAEDAEGIARVQVRGWQIGYQGLIPKDYLDRMNIVAFTERWERSLAGEVGGQFKGSNTVLVAEDDGALVGFAGYDANEDGLGYRVGELNGLYVEPDCWGRGIGSALITEVHAGLVARGFTEAILWTLEANERTRRFYDRHGWTPDGGTKLHRSGVPLVRLRRSLP